MVRRRCLASRGVRVVMSGRSKVNCVDWKRYLGFGGWVSSTKDLRRWVKGKAKLAPVPACRGSGYPSNMKACATQRKAFSTVWAPACLPLTKNPHQGRQIRGFKIFLWECTKYIYVL